MKTVSNKKYKRHVSSSQSVKPKIMFEFDENY